MPLPSFFADAVRDCIAHFPLRHTPSTTPLCYGTAGFRATAAVLPPIAARVTFVAALRIWWAIQNTSAPAGCSLGCMITASHNPEPDNGMKLIDMDGGMLTKTWEGVCTDVANTTTGEELLKILEDWASRNNICVPSVKELEARCSYAAIHLARDSRSSGEEILSAIQRSLQALHLSSIEYGIITTPHLHYMVQRANLPSLGRESLITADFGPSLYWCSLLSALKALLAAVVVPSQEKRKRQKIVVDAANGVGALGLKSLLQISQELLPNILDEYFEIIILNDSLDKHESLNHMCGADFTQKTRSPSSEMKKWATDYEDKKVKNGEEKEVHYYSFDGDADRVVAFFHDYAEGDVWHLLDGDRISILYALALRHWLGKDVLHSLDVGVVQTAYANGASTDYLQQQLNLHVYSAATGVKNLHSIAHKRDIGVYFEANGHGTILFNQESIRSKLKSGSINSQTEVVLTYLPLLLSQVCGDAMADAFACEIALLALQMRFKEWLNLYVDRPSLQSKVIVPNPKVITNTADERHALTPFGLQESIDAAVTATSSATQSAARAFVRPSGTEPVVRVYVEASDAAACQKLLTEVEIAVKKYCESS
ncbi:Alpha-D-phosphohexomutase [Trypanosoma melophagium]|uniref:Alpha-D-phosphohexomutase n=1 Tax=Trypanosoma melophagium TaxID=715481 RepID=UPI00351A738A|nr:Alpha-D-phosphohexomutase [Trypanosoma melophagium]